ncbi:MAG: hypothetical protein M1834_004327 [Cirrosporium novae-zelandiae]|nr:MAG: hypothetical protein M1834_004327 [Cirrosporium novae-zelandiae]
MQSASNHLVEVDGYHSEGLLDARDVALVGTSLPNHGGFKVYHAILHTIHQYGAELHDDFPATTHKKMVRPLDVSHLWKQVETSKVPMLDFIASAFRNTMKAYVSEHPIFRDALDKMNSFQSNFSLRTKIPINFECIAIHMLTQYMRHHSYGAKGYPKTDGHLHQVHKLIECFLDTLECFVNACGRPVFTCTITAHKGIPIVAADWHPAFLSFRNFRSRVKEGKEYCLIPYYKRQFRLDSPWCKTSSSYEVSIPWLTWDDEISGFRGTAPIYGNTRETPLQVTVKATIEDHFSFGIFEHCHRVRVSLIILGVYHRPQRNNWDYNSPGTIGTLVDDWQDHVEPDTLRQSDHETMVSVGQNQVEPDTPRQYDSSEDSSSSLDSLPSPPYTDEYVDDMQPQVEAVEAQTERARGHLETLAGMGTETIALEDAEESPKEKKKTVPEADIPFIPLPSPVASECSRFQDVYS